MATKYICLICDRGIHYNSKSIECSKCLCWIHKGCSGLSTPEFNKIVADSKKKSAHSWFCNECKNENEVRINSNDSSNFCDSGVATLPSNGQSQPASDSSVAGTKKCSLIQGYSSYESINNILSRESVEVKDLIKVILEMFRIITEQNNKIETILNQINVQNSDQEIRTNIGSGSKPNDISPSIANSEVYEEMCDRIQRSRNLIVYNIPESPSQDIQVRINYDREELKKAFTKVKVTCNDFKFFRLGKSGSTTRPLKVIFSDDCYASACLKNWKLLADTNIKFCPDRTVMQREAIRKAYEERNLRLRNGEKELKVKIIHGVPKIVKSSKKPQILNVSKNQ